MPISLHLHYCGIKCSLCLQWVLFHSGHKSILIGKVWIGFKKFSSDLNRNKKNNQLINCCERNWLKNFIFGGPHLHLHGLQIYSLPTMLYIHKNCLHLNYVPKITFKTYQKLIRNYKSWRVYFGKILCQNLSVLSRNFMSKYFYLFVVFACFLTFYFFLQLLVSLGNSYPKALLVILF